MERAWCLRSYRGQVCELRVQTPPDAWTSPAGPRRKRVPELEQGADVALLSRPCCSGGVRLCLVQGSPAHPGREGSEAAVPPITSGAALTPALGREADVAQLCRMCRLMTEDAFKLKSLGHPEAFPGSHSEPGPVVKGLFSPAECDTVRKTGQVHGNEPSRVR